MTILVIKFKELFLPNENEFLENERGVFSSHANIKKNPSGFTKVSHIGNIERIFRVYLSEI